MSNERFDDELLSAIIDGDADEASVASVLADETASQRLDAMRTAAGIVAEEPAPATPARREQSIAAALAAAKPAPEVTSLTTERVARRSGPSPKILAIAAAVLLFIIAIPVIAGIRSASVETATDAAAEASTELGASDAAADVVEDAVDGDDDEAMEDDGGVLSDDDEEEAMEDDEGDVPAAVQSPESADDAGDAGDAEEEFAPVTERSLAERLAARPPAVSASESLIGIDDLIQLGSVFPQYTLDELLDAGVSPDCVDQDSTAVGFDVVLLDDESRLIIVEFFDDETTRLLDAEDCSVLR